MCPHPIRRNAYKAMLNISVHDLYTPALHVGSANSNTVVIKTSFVTSGSEI